MVLIFFLTFINTELNYLGDSRISNEIWTLSGNINIKKIVGQKIIDGKFIIGQGLCTDDLMGACINIQKTDLSIMAVRLNPEGRYYLLKDAPEKVSLEEFVSNLKNYSIVSLTLSTDINTDTTTLDTAYLFL